MPSGCRGSKSMTAKRFLFILASIVVSVISLALVLRAVPINDVVNSLRSADPAYLLIALLFATLALLTRGIRWWLLLDRRISVAESFHMVNVMFLGNQLPFRLGEVARGILAARRGVPLVTSGASIIVERLIDMLVVVLVIAYAVSLLPSVPSDITEKAALFGALALVGFLVLLAFAHAPGPAHGLLNAILKAAPPLKRLPLRTMLEHLLEALRPLTDLRTLGNTAIWTALAWAAALAAFYFSHLALGIEVDYLISVSLGIALTALSIAFPVSVAALGPFELAILTTGRLVGMSDADALALGFLLHGINVFSYALWGTIGLLALGASPAMAFSANRTARDQA
ncbi:MAG: flippase-like domain-containing protein [Chloroflexi bacterium]|nr:flippase-like domain-containing protein [Chloroflexota bacterium]